MDGRGYVGVFFLEGNPRFKRALYYGCVESVCERDCKESEEEFARYVL